jgi:hypothetical protein
MTLKARQILTKQLPCRKAMRKRKRKELLLLHQRLAGKDAPVVEAANTEDLYYMPLDPEEEAAEDAEANRLQHTR